MTPRDGELGGEQTVSWRTCSRLPLCLLTPDMQHRRIVDGAFRPAGAAPAPAVETNSISALVDPEIEHTIGLVVSKTTERSPVIAELLSICEPLEPGRAEP